MGILYLDVDDEITSAASRMRTAVEPRVALVLPAGSRLGTSRINFRLLAREAATSGRALAIVSPEAPTRALAASAGLPVFATVFEYEAALAEPAAPPDAPVATSAGAGAAGAGIAAGAGAAGAGAAGAGAGGRMSPAGRPPTPSPESRPATASHGDALREGMGPATPSGGVGPGVGAPASAASRPSRRSIGLLVGLAALAVVVAIGGVLAWVLLPSATVTVTVRPEVLGPLQLTVTADPDAAAADPAASVVPAERPTFDLAASGTFQATGKKVTETKATGSVRWQNCDPTSAYRIPGGTVVRTSGGVRFTIDEAVFLPVALLAGNPPTITCQSRDVGITAAAPGEAGNVAAGTITVVPAAYNSVVVRVVNGAKTEGGTHAETPLVTQKDVDAALKSLAAKLDAQLAAILADPARLPAGRLAFADTASRTAAVPDPDPGTLVGQELAGFDLAASATGSVTAIDEASVRGVAEAAITGSVPRGETLVAGSVRVDVGEPTVAGRAVRFPVTATGQVVRSVDPAEVRRAVVGRPLDEARTAAAAFGEATIDVWPGWVTTIPTLDFRLTVEVRSGEGSGGGSSAPLPAPGASSAVPGAASPSTGGASARPGGTSAYPSATAAP